MCKMQSVLFHYILFLFHGKPFWIPSHILAIKTSSADWLLLKLPFPLLCFLHQVLSFTDLKLIFLSKSHFYAFQASTYLVFYVYALCFQVSTKKENF